MVCGLTIDQEKNLLQFPFSFRWQPTASMHMSRFQLLIINTTCWLLVDWWDLEQVICMHVYFWLCWTHIHPDIYGLLSPRVTSSQSPIRHSTYRCLIANIFPIILPLLMMFPLPIASLFCSHDSSSFKIQFKFHLFHEAFLGYTTASPTCLWHLLIYCFALFSSLITN